MVIKSFTAPTVAAALKMVKAKLGGEAVVLRTRILREGESGGRGERVEVTACIDEGVVTAGHLDEILAPKKRMAEPKPAERIAPAMPEMPKVTVKAAEEKNYSLKAAQAISEDARKSLNPDPAKKFENSLQPIYLDLLDGDVPAEFARQIMKAVEERHIPGCDTDTAAHEVIHENISEMIALEPEYKPGMRVVFVGHSGAGKTSALAKLAAKLTAERKMKVCLGSLDDIKVSAFEEIGGYADILDIPVAGGETLLAKNAKDTLTLIDTPSIPLDNRRRLELIKKIRAVRPDLVFMVFSVFARTRDLMDSINVFESISPTHLIASHLDATMRWGGITAMARYLEIPLAYVMNAPGGIGRLKNASADEITRQLLKVEEAIYE